MARSVQVLLLSVFLIGAGVYAHHELGRTACDMVIGYRIGVFDREFNIGVEEFKAAIADAEALWEEAAGRELFMYDPEGAFTINLVFDERQRRTIEESKLRNRLATLEETHDTVTDNYRAELTQYEEARAAYEAAVRRYEGELSAFNAEVERWNRRGGAPESEYRELEEQRARFATRAAELERDRIALNTQSTELNRLGSQGNELAERYNKQISNYEQRFGESHEFNQGEYRGDAITIYQFDGAEDLQLVLAHELGHALGIEHVENPVSLMYYLMGEQSLTDLALTIDDRAALAEVCNLR